MAETLKQQDPEFVRSTFEGISRRYDLANHVLSCGADFFWRAKAAAMVAERAPRRILDLATGSGDLALAMRRTCPRAEVIGADFCAPMLEVAAAKGLDGLAQADGLALPFRDGVFDVVTVAFGLRNMASWEGALGEMARVLRPGGFLFVMDFSLPRPKALREAYRFYLRRILPRLAGWLTGRPEAYDYLGESIEKFPRDGEMLALIERAGFREARQIPLALGIASIYHALRRE